MNDYIIGIFFLAWIAGATTVTISTIELQINDRIKVWQAAVLVFVEVYLFLVVPAIYIAKHASH